MSDEDFNSGKHQGALWKGCRWMKAAAGAEPESAGPQAKTAQADLASPISGQIDEVMRSGHYRALPAPRVSPDDRANGASSLKIKNSSQYDLTVLCGGPAECTAQIPAGSSVAVKLQPGSYRMVARFGLPGTRPMFEQYAFESGYIYSFDFVTATN